MVVNTKETDLLPLKNKDSEENAPLFNIVAENENNGKFSIKIPV